MRTSMVAEQAAVPGEHVEQQEEPLPIPEQAAVEQAIAHTQSFTVIVIDLQKIALRYLVCKALLHPNV